jgi:DNA invertase Pin-like site-specific DNA recombinase
MKSIKYVRVSTQEQNTARQTRTDDLTLIDICSGSTSFNERKQGSKVLKMARNNEISAVNVHSIDRLGRNTLDILNTIQELTKLGVNVVSEKEGLQTLINGKENPVSKLMINILATLSEFELNRIKERQMEGIAEAKKRGVYKSNGGNKPKETVKQFISKKANAKCYKLIKTGSSLRNASRLSEVSLGTAQKISKYMNEGLLGN